MAGIDRISALPDEVLHLILSDLTTKEVVRTQLVSKRWKNLWTCMPALDFDFADFMSEDTVSRREHSTYIKVDSECHDNFVRFIDAVLASRQIQQLDRFRLVWKYQVKSYYHHDHPVRRWVLCVMQQKPQVLSIYVQPCEVRVDVPDEAFACSSLKELKLQVHNKIWPEILEPASVNLPSLRSLNLGYYTINADFMSKLLLGCPNLENLELYACRLNLAQISCNSLKCLVIDGCCNSTDILVSIPSLQYLKVTVMSCQTAGIDFENMTSLSKACVCFFTADELFPKAFYQSEAKMLNGLSEVTYLDVLLHGTEAAAMLNHALANDPEFDNLEIVHVESFDGCLLDCIDTIERLIQHSLSLEYLTYYCCKDSSDEFELEEQLKVLLTEHEICWPVECNQGHIYDSLDQLDKQLIQHMIRFEKMLNEVDAEEEDESEEEGAVGLVAALGSGAAAAGLEEWEGDGEEVEVEVEEEEEEDEGEEER